MLKYVLAIVFLFFFLPFSNGQYLQPAIDSAVNSRYSDGMIPVEGYDSIRNAVVNNYIQKEILPDRIFNWPSQVMNFYPSATYRYLLMHKYNIAEALSHGCVRASYQHCYDSIIANELRKNYGNDFFEESSAEAALLDSNKMGLTLPYLLNTQKELLSFVKKAFPFIDTFKFSNSKEHVRFIILNFKGDTLSNAYFGQSVWGIQTSLDLMQYSENLTQTLNKLKWVGPKFRNKPAERTVLLDLNKSTFSFYGW
jgi:hypothetical protein